MLDNNNYNSPCEFAVEMISYLYGEADTLGKVEFETHLNKCSKCADEFAGFSLVRSSVLQLREEFSTMETPSFVLPTKKRKELTEIVSVKAETGSWLAGLRKLFSLSPAWATTAVAALAICLGLTLIVLNFSQNDEIAENNKNDSQSVVSPIIEKKIENTKENADQRNTVEDFPNNLAKPQNLKAENLPHAVRTSQSKQPRLNDSITKISNVSRSKTNDNKSFQRVSGETVRKNNETGNGNKKSPSLQARKVPRLVEADDEEDNSLRLADLFDEVGAK